MQSLIFYFVAINDITNPLLPIANRPETESETYTREAHCPSE